MYTYVYTYVYIIYVCVHISTHVCTTLLVTTYCTRYWKGPCSPGAFSLVEIHTNQEKLNSCTQCSWSPGNTYNPEKGMTGSLPKGVDAEMALKGRIGSGLRKSW